MFAEAIEDLVALKYRNTLSVGSFANVSFVASEKIRASTGRSNDETTTVDGLDRYRFTLYFVANIESPEASKICSHGKLKSSGDLISTKKMLYNSLVYLTNADQTFPTYHFL